MTDHVVPGLSASHMKTTLRTAARPGFLREITSFTRFLFRGKALLSFRCFGLSELPLVREVLGNSFCHAFVQLMALYRHDLAPGSFCYAMADYALTGNRNAAEGFRLLEVLISWMGLQWNKPRSRLQNDQDRGASGRGSEGPVSSWCASGGPDEDQAANRSSLRAHLVLMQN